MSGQTTNQWLAEQLARKYLYLYDLLFKRQERRGGTEMDNTVLAILNHVCNLKEATPHTTLYYHKMVNPLLDIAAHYKDEGLLIGWSIENKSFIFKLAVEDHPGPPYSIRMVYPHPAAIFQPACETVH